MYKPSRILGRKQYKKSLELNAKLKLHERNFPQKFISIKCPIRHLYDDENILRVIDQNNYLLFTRVG